MNPPVLHLTQPGLLTTIQDRGRHGYQRYGVPVSGAMDEFALRMANILAGNDQNAAALEITLQGPTIKFLTTTWIALTGADLSPTLDDQPIPRWQSLQAHAGSTLAFGQPRDGTRTYLAVHGGIDAPIVMGSRSTYLKGQFGGLQGRALRKGDQLSTLPTNQTPFTPKRLPKNYTAPLYGGSHRLRVILGPQQDAFDRSAISTFLDSRYKISPQSDRMGYTLEGPKIEHRHSPDIISDGNPPGAVQIPGDGAPRILLADRGTTGGYTKIASVITPDLSKLAQALPSHTVAFQQISIQEAQDTLHDREALIRAVERQGRIPAMSISLDGLTFDVQTPHGQPLTRQEPIDPPSETAPRRIGATLDNQTYDFQPHIHREA